MGAPRIVLAGAAVLAIAGLCIALRGRNGAGATVIAPHGSAPAARPAPAADAVASVRHDEEPSPTPAPQQAPAAPDGSPMPLPVADKDASPSAARAVQDSSPAPTGGKPVAPVDLAWRILVATDGSRTFSGIVVITTLSGPARIDATCTALDGATLTSPADSTFTDVAAKQQLSIPVSGTLSAAVGNPGAITISVSYTTSDIRGRAVRIDLQEPAAAAAAAAQEAAKRNAPPDPTRPMEGVHVIQDDAGGRTVLQPSVPPPAR